MEKVIKLSVNDDTFNKAYLTILTVGLGLSDEERSTLIEIANGEESTLGKRKLYNILQSLKNKGLVTQDNKLHAGLNVERGNTTISFELRFI